MTTLARLVSDTERGLSQKKESVMQKIEAMKKEGSSGEAKLHSVQPTEALKVFFDRIPLDSIPGIGNVGVVEVRAEQTMEEAIQLLYRKDVLGAPVLDETTSETLSLADRYVGLLDFGQMVLWALEEFDVGEKQAQIQGLMVDQGRQVQMESPKEDMTVENIGKDDDTSATDEAAAYEKDDFFALLRRFDDVRSSKVGTMSRSFRWGPYLPLRANDSLLHVLLLLSKHRLKAAPVVETNRSKVKGFITQDAAMQILLQCSGLSWFDHIAKKPLSDFRFEAEETPGPLVFVHGDKPVSYAFHCLWKERLNAVPVIDRQTHRLSGSIRTTDVKLLLDKPELFRRRRVMTVDEFMNAEPEVKSLDRQRSAVEEGLGAAISAASLTLGSFTLPRMQDPVTSTASETLETTIKKLVKLRSDRSFMINENQHLIGVITLRDIITQFSPPLAEAPEQWGGFFDNALQQTGTIMEPGSNFMFEGSPPKEA